MIRKAFVMNLRPGCEAEYIHRHNPIWPELQEVLRIHGVSNYAIFLDREAGKLFAYAEIESLERWQAIAATEVCRRWWAYMQDLMATNADNSPVANDLVEVFRLPSAILGLKKLLPEEKEIEHGWGGCGGFTRIFRPFFIRVNPHNPFHPRSIRPNRELLVCRDVD